MYGVVRVRFFIELFYIHRTTIFKHQTPSLKINLNIKISHAVKEHAMPLLPICFLIFLNTNVSIIQ